VKTCNEKWILRVAFEDTGLLPHEVLWRRKEAFSDGVSAETKSWYEEIQERLEKSDGEIKEKYVKNW
jgi:asparagine synthase (glutamine-hydrolysing)